MFANHTQSKEIKKHPLTKHMPHYIFMGLIKKAAMNTKLLIKIRGKTNNPIYRLYTRLSAKKLGLTTHAVNNRPGELSITLEGKTEALWKMIEKCKHSKIYASVTQVSFEFIR